MRPDFVSFRSIPRLMRECVVTEKIDGTNALVCVTDDGGVFAGSRNRWVTPEDDNHGFAAWVATNEEELRQLGPGMHYGEWWGAGIQRRYGLMDRRFSLFNVERWMDADERPVCCDVVPVLYQGAFSTETVRATLAALSQLGSRAAPGFMNPEGVVVRLEASRSLHKVTLGDDGHKTKETK